MARKRSPPILGLALSTRPGAQGLLIVKVLPGSSAERVGLEIGDELLSIAGAPLLRGELWRTRIRRKEGQPLPLVWLRDGKKLEGVAVLEAILR